MLIRMPWVVLSTAITISAAVAAQSPLTGTNWPSFRGAFAAGNAPSIRLPDKWDGPSGQNIAWKTSVPGLAHSSPIVWGNRVFVTSAISSRSDATFKPGLYGDGTASDDRSPHKWVLIAYDRATGKKVWERTAHEG